jgi:hypothetical protein
MLCYVIASATPGESRAGKECTGEGEGSMGLHGLNKIESKTIELETLDLYSESSYLLTTIELMDDGLIMNTYLVDQEGLNTFFGSYGEHGEFAIELKRFEA